MKLHEMNTNQLADCLCKIAAPLERIGKDEALTAYMQGLAKAAKPEDTVLSRALGMAAALVPILLQTHRADTYAVLSALTGKSVEEIAAQPGIKTLREARDCFDKDLMDFFKSSGGLSADA